MRFPGFRISSRIVGRALFIWLLLRSVSWVLTWVDLGLLTIPWRTAAWILLVTVTLTWLEGRRQHEHILLANLGFGTWWFLALAALPAVTLEAGIQVALR